LLTFHTILTSLIKKTRSLTERVGGAQRKKNNHLPPLPVPYEFVIQIITGFNHITYFWALHFFFFLGAGIPVMAFWRDRGLKKLSFKSLPPF